jgi:hypothetical protein
MSVLVKKTHTIHAVLEVVANMEVVGMIIVVTRLIQQVPILTLAIKMHTNHAVLEIVANMEAVGMIIVVTRLMLIRICR